MSKVQSHSGIAKAIFEFGHKASTVIIVRVIFNLLISKGLTLRLYKLVDGSASVPQHGFETMVHTVRTIINRLPVGKKFRSVCCGVGAIQFQCQGRVPVNVRSSPISQCFALYVIFSINLFLIRKRPRIHYFVPQQ